MFQTFTMKKSYDKLSQTFKEHLTSRNKKVQKALGSTTALEERIVNFSQLINDITIHHKTKNFKQIKNKQHKQHQKQHKHHKQHKQHKHQQKHQQKHQPKHKHQQQQQQQHQQQYIKRRRRRKNIQTLKLQQLICMTNGIKQWDNKKQKQGGLQKHIYLNYKEQQHKRITFNQMFKRTFSLQLKQYTNNQKRKQRQFIMKNGENVNVSCHQSCQLSTMSPKCIQQKSNLNIQYLDNIKKDYMKYFQQMKGCCCCQKLPLVDKEKHKEIMQINKLNKHIRKQERDILISQLFKDNNNNNNQKDINQDKLISSTSTSSTSFCFIPLKSLFRIQKSNKILKKQTSSAATSTTTIVNKFIKCNKAFKFPQVNNKNNKNNNKNNCCNTTKMLNMTSMR